MKAREGFVRKKLNSGLVSAAALLLVSLFISAACEMGPPTRSMVVSYDLTDLVTRPVAGQEPDYKVIDTDQYYGTLSWRKEDGTTGLDTAYKFESNTVYKVYITLTAKDPWTFAGVGENAFHYDYAIGKSPANLDITAKDYHFDETAPGTTWRSNTTDKANVFIIFPATTY
jgi:hypothetical protein